ncbi:MAG: UDP-N-acetylmuramoyl-tripeptide--D-alanyl-D-alanine ligase [Saprospiraceae bacterium]|nr:MAG: UDP-N-acetylmuramoyl-tripeptide--D-alanyl-D-alanine ligase [Saprospiraceae bacterium]
MKTTIEELYDIFLKYPGICTDTRKLQQGDLFFALKGDRFNGNLFAKTALDAGAAFAIIDDPTLADEPGMIWVDDTLKCLQDLAHHHRSQLDIPIIALTGSNGKTTTKELMAVVMGSHYPLQYTKGNLNNHIGVPLSLLSIGPDAEVAIIEMGANHQGEIDALCRIAAPTHGLVTNIGKAHLEGFGGEEGVRKGKSELFRYLEETGGVAFVNLSEPHLLALSEGVNKRIFYKQDEVCRNTGPFYAVRLVEANPFVVAEFLGENSQPLQINSELIGQYNFSNIMTAIVIGWYFKVPGDQIKSAIESYVPANNRSQLLHLGSNTLILDAYNANPSSMQQALMALKVMKGEKKMAILGDMLELGQESENAHQEIAQLANELLLVNLVLVGPHFAEIAHTLNLKHFEDATALGTWFQEQVFEDTLILLKGSRGMALEKILPKENAGKH